MGYERIRADAMVEKVKHIYFDLSTKFNNKYPYNLGYNWGSYWTWDCWNFYPKTLIWGWNEDIPVGQYQRPNLETGLGDWNGWTILNCCSNISRDFSSLVKAEFMLIEDKGHAGCYVGEFTDKMGQLCNVIECTTSWGENRVTGSWVDADGTRRNCKGGTAKGKWGWHGMLTQWIDYSMPHIDVLAVDGSWGMATTRYTQKLFNTVVDGIISGQPRSNKKYLPNCYTGSWDFVWFGASGSDVIRAIQSFLANQGYYTGAIDGYCGKGTVIAIQRFLADKGLYTDSIDGSMGYNTVCGWQKYINSQF